MKYILALYYFSMPFSNQTSNPFRSILSHKIIFKGDVFSSTNETKRVESQLTGNIDHRDVVIIGSGPAGCTAAIYASRALLKPLVVAGYQSGGQLMLTNDIENFPGYRKAVSGPEMMEDITVQARNFGAEFWNVNCEYINTKIYPYRIQLPNCTIITKSIIIATGADAIWLNAPNEEEFRGRGISTCATCDGYIFRNRSVAVIGGGDSSMEEATFLTRFASSVTIIHRSDTFRASKLMMKRAMDNPKIRFLTNTTVRAWRGKDSLLSGATVLTNGVEREIDFDGAFIAIGHRPNTVFLDRQLELDESGYIRLHHNTMTSLPGIFACGDCVDKRYRQAISAAGSGCQAAIDAERWLEEHHEQDFDKTASPSAFEFADGLDGLDRN